MVLGSDRRRARVVMGRAGVANMFVGEWWGPTEISIHEACAREGSQGKSVNQSSNFIYISFYRHAPPI